MPTTANSGINEICHAMPSVTELVLSEWRSMLSSDISDLKFWIKTFYMQQSLVHHATPLQPNVHPPLSNMQDLLLFILLMSVMLKMPFVALITGHLVMIGVGSQWSGLGWRRNWCPILSDHDYSFQGERGRPHDGSRSVANQRPTKTLFVINFDPKRTTVRDIERHFESYGRILHVRIRRNFAFVQFETQEDATRALECTHMSKLLDRVVSVEYALRDDDEKGDRYYDSPRRGGYGGRGVSPYRRSPSPVYHRRPSPDYGRPRSPAYDRYNGPAYDKRRSPEYGRNRSPEYGRYRSRSPVRRSRT